MERKTKLPKSIKLYLSNKLKKKVPSLNLNSSINPSRFRSACQYPRTRSFDTRDCQNTHDHSATNNAATLSDIDQFLFKNFSSLYINDNDSTPSVTSSSSSSMTNETSKAAATGVGIVIVSTDPYEDFRTSMKRMVDAHHTGASQSLDWDFMEELLICYLQLNDKSMHKHVLRGFSNITAGFRRSKVSVVSRRTVPVSRKKQTAAEREEMPDSPDQHFAADFAEDFDSKLIK